MKRDLSHQGVLLIRAPRTLEVFLLSPLASEARVELGVFDGRHGDTFVSDARRRNEELMSCNNN